MNFTVVYFLKERRFRGNIKIGYSTITKNRVSELQVGNSQELQVLLVAEGDRGTESALHNKFKRLKVRGEWFKADKELLDFIQELKMAGLNIVQPSSPFRMVGI